MEPKAPPTACYLSPPFIIILINNKNSLTGLVQPSIHPPTNQSIHPSVYSAYQRHTSGIPATMAIVESLDAVRGMLPENIPLTLIGVGATVLIGIIYSVVAQERPLAGFPMASLDGKSPKKSWLFHGREVVAEAVKKV